jgi:cytosine/adenosine deaminase-related metal-dependent hydrolase
MAGRDAVELNPVLRARCARVRLALGTDAVPEVPATMLDQLRAALMLARGAARDDMALTGEQALAMATTGGGGLPRRRRPR